MTLTVRSTVTTDRTIHITCEMVEYIRRLCTYMIGSAGCTSGDGGASLVVESSILTGRGTRRINITESTHDVIYRTTLGVWMNAQ